MNLIYSLPCILLIFTIMGKVINKIWKLVTIFVQIILGFPENYRHVFTYAMLRKYVYVFTSIYFRVK